MESKEGPEGGKSKPAAKRRGRRTDRSFSEYAGKHIPKGAVLDYIFYEDFDGDGKKEAVIGYTQFSPFPPESSAIFIKRNEEEYSHIILTEGKNIEFAEFGIFDQAAAADTDGDGLPELIVSLAAGNGHYITIFVFDWYEGNPRLALRTEDSFYHGSLEIYDTDDDSVCELVVESGTMKGNEILELDESCFHVRESCYYKWDGIGYIKWPYHVRMPYISYNAAVEFLLQLWKQEYRNTYDMVFLPAFMGLGGLDDSSPNAYKRFVEKNIRPVLLRNLSESKLTPSEPFDSYCMFLGSKDDITVEMVKHNGLLKVQSLNIFKRDALD